MNRWRDAERDCTTALSLAKGQSSVKALYRRSLARKALDDIDGALEGTFHPLFMSPSVPNTGQSLKMVTDIDTVLKREPSNETAKEEKVELEDLRRKATSEREIKAQVSMRTASSARIDELTTRRRK